MKTPPEKPRLLMVGALLALIGVCAVAALVFSLKKAPDEEILTLYREVAATSQARQYPRPEAATAQGLEDGPAAPLYQQAYEGCPTLQDNNDDDLNESMNRALAVIAPSALSPPVDREAGRSLPESCAALGIVDKINAPGEIPGQRDLFLNQLDDTLCLALKDCEGAIDTLERATRRKDARSPVSIWDPWSSSGGGNMRAMKPFIKLAKLTLIRGHLQARLGDPPARGRSGAVVLRQGFDMSHGGGLIGGLIGVSIDKIAVRSLHKLLLSCDLTEAEAKATLDELNALRLDPFNPLDAFVGEYLMVTPMLLASREGLAIPTTAPPHALPADFIERILLNDHAHNHHEMWKEIFDGFNRPYPQRVAQREAVTKRLSKKLNPLTQIGLPNYDRYDAEFVLANLRLDMLAVLAAARLHALRHGTPPDPGQLAALLGGSLPEDPFAGEAVRVELKGDTLLLEAPALASQAILFAGDDAERADGLRVALQVPDPACAAPEPAQLPEPPAP